MTNALRGQFEIDLPDGTTVPCLLNMYAVQVWCEETGNTLTDLDEQLQKNLLQSLPGLTWAGVRTHYELAEEAPPISESRYKILLGSADWDEVTTKLVLALNLDKDTATAKKKTASPKSR